MLDKCMLLNMSSSENKEIIDKKKMLSFATV